ncbi:hypothetical protein [Haloarcula sp. 1CSR25-25]|uniref:hypothetical protein n=1 Tax=Haloarcula sp. 1CSR25-25 TaxID=2862545 RepID=UPI0028940E7C|nr:hypothetical protein [Haloarcula sp. 1CSR25-25]MDT3436062.1 hypothetical protein [Haloarcula sp. 1CSR25-25]
MTSRHESGDRWTEHYRGYRLRTNPDGDVWWQAYQGTDRLYLEPAPEDLVESLLELKRLGGRIRITEGNDVLTRAEEGDEYETYWIGSFDLKGELIPPEDPDFSVPVQPDDLEPGDFWPSVYDGAKYSFGPGVERIWWDNPQTHKRHPVQESLSQELVTTLSRYKPQGGSLRVTPWNDILTLVDLDKLPSQTKTEFDSLPRVVKNLIALRRDRGGVQKLPIYAGQVDDTPFSIDDPPSLTDPFEQESGGVDSWLDSLGETSQTDVDNHTVSGSEIESDPGNEHDTDIPDDDPVDW